MVHQFFIALVALLHRIAGQEMYIENRGVLITTTVDPDIDLNFTVAEACQLLGQFNCILSERIYIRCRKLLNKGTQ